MKLYKASLLGWLMLVATTFVGIPQAGAEAPAQAPYGRTERWNDVYQVVQKRLADHLLGKKTAVHTDQLTYWVSEAILNAIQAQKKRFSPEKVQRLANRAFNRLLSSINYVIATPGLSSAEISRRFKEDLDTQGIM